MNYAINNTAIASHLKWTNITINDVSHGDANITIHLEDGTTAEHTITAIQSRWIPTRGGWWKADKPILFKNTNETLCNLENNGVEDFDAYLDYLSVARGDDIDVTAEYELYDESEYWEEYVQHCKECAAEWVEDSLNDDIEELRTTRPYYWIEESGEAHLSYIDFGLSDEYVPSQVSDDIDCDVDTWLWERASYAADDSDYTPDEHIIAHRRLDDSYDGAMFFFVTVATVRTSETEWEKRVCRYLTNGAIGEAQDQGTVVTTMKEVLKEVQRAMSDEALEYITA